MESMITCVWVELLVLIFPTSQLFDTIITALLFRNSTWRKKKIYEMMWKRGFSPLSNDRWTRFSGLLVERVFQELAEKNSIKIDWMNLYSPGDQRRDSEWMLMLLNVKRLHWFLKSSSHQLVVTCHLVSFYTCIRPLGFKPEPEGTVLTI